MSDRITLDKNGAEFIMPKRKVNKVKAIKTYNLLSFKKVRHRAALYDFSKGCEDYFQAMLVKYVKEIYPEVIVFSIPNGTNKTPMERLLFKQTGLLPGVSDLIIAQPNKDFHGLCLELKTKVGSPSNEQCLFGKKMKSKGYDWKVSKDLIECIDYVDDYLSKT